MLYLFWYNTFKRLFIIVLYNYLRQGAVMGMGYCLIMLKV